MNKNLMAVNTFTDLLHDKAQLEGELLQLQNAVLNFITKHHDVERWFIARCICDGKQDGDSRDISISTQVLLETLKNLS
jgi:hypothetical protein